MNEKLIVARMMVEYGELGLKNSWQKEFPSTTECVYCGCDARIAFVSYEPRQEIGKTLSAMHENDRDGDGMWLHDNFAFATYLCKECLEPTTIYNQATWPSQIIFIF
jgi:hypothetical protein